MYYHVSTFITNMIIILFSNSDVIIFVNIQNIRRDRYKSQDTSLSREMIGILNIVCSVVLNVKTLEIDTVKNVRFVSVSVNRKSYEHREIRLSQNLERASLTSS